MIQAYTESDFIAYLSTEDNRINTSLPKENIAYLVKLINDMDGSIDYVYPFKFIYNRYTIMQFYWEETYVNMFQAQVNLLPAGYWKYEVYEVSWENGVPYLIDKTNAPSTETEVLEPSPNHGIVQGLVTKGKMYLAEKDGTEQVQYNQHESEEGTNYIYYGQ